MKATANPRALLFFILASLAPCLPAMAQDKETADAKSAPAPTTATPAAAPAGLLPIPDYTADFWDNSYLTGDWGGARTQLANKGVQVGVEWNQFYQGLSSGGLKPGSDYDSNFNYTINLDLMKMGVLHGAIIKFRAESRFGESVNGDTGAILPVNTQALFPLTTKLNQNIGITITDLNYTQFLSPNFGVIVGKVDTLDGDHNEFASGRGTSQFMNANFVFNPTLALRLPYSTLAAGLIWMPIPPGEKGGIVVTNTFLNTDDSSTTSGFDDFNKGTSWNPEADFTYCLGSLPGGMNVGALYSFDQRFADVRDRLVLNLGEGLAFQNKNSTWAAYWSAWQYLYTLPDGGKPLAQLQGGSNRKGIGFFSRIGTADKETNPVSFAVSGGIGGRGMIPTRDNDNFGIGYYYNEIQQTRLSGLLNIEDSSQGFECFYNVAITPAARVTFDVQVVQPVVTTVHTATILGLRASFDF